MKNFRKRVSNNKYKSFWNEKEELLTDPDELQKLWILRKVLHPMDELAAVEFLINKMQDTKTNDKFFDAMKR